jgi:hypothetical protein
MQSLNRLGIILAFKINQDYITAAFCVNKDKPEMHCNGKCVLAKKLKNAEQNEEKQRTENMERANVLFFCKLNRLELSACLYNIKAAAVNPFYLNGTLSSFSNDIFKPPQIGNS